MLEVSRERIRKAHLEVNEILDLSATLDVSVSYDGSWQKQGHTSYLGLGVVIDILTGLVIDYEAFICQNCTVTKHDLGDNSAEFLIWYESHINDCEKNFTESSGAIMVEAELRLWRRSVTEYNMRYTSILSDGDSKTFQTLTESIIYGPEVTIMKEEYLNHVAKRLGTALRNKVIAHHPTRNPIIRNVQKRDHLDVSTKEQMPRVKPLTPHSSVKMHLSQLVVEGDACISASGIK